MRRITPGLRGIPSSGSQSTIPVSVAPGAESPHGFTPGPLRRDQVHYLVFEGGGGKGFAYLGALQALEQLKILQYGEHTKTKKPTLVGPIKGIGGASAGAITALLVSIGYTSTELESFMTTTPFDQFFDPADPRKRPIVGGCLPVSNTEEEEKIRQILQKVEAVIMATLTIRESFRFPPLRSLPGLREPILPKILELLSKANTPPFSTLIKDRFSIGAYLWNDMGIFSGCYARDVFDKVLGERMGLNRPAPYNVTFKEHYKYFGIKLAVSGTNLETGKTEIFTVPRYDEFYVADAIRISMGIPFIYKPYVIHAEGDLVQQHWTGTWVDGGVWNNLPFKEFENERGENPKTLALRLELEKNFKINNFRDFLRRWFNFAIFGSGESQITEANVSQTILLDTTGLELVNFSPPKDIRDKIISKARQDTMKYFRAS